MVERADGTRLLLAPRDDVADLVAATYDVRRGARRARSALRADEGRRRWRLRAGPLTADLTRRRAHAPSGTCSRWCRATAPLAPLVATAADPVARVLLDGVRTRGTAGRGRREWYVADRPARDHRGAGAVGVGGPRRPAPVVPRGAVRVLLRAGGADRDPRADDHRIDGGARRGPGTKIVRASDGRSHPRPEGPSVLRTHTAGSLRAEHIGTTVTLTGWVDRRRDHGGVAFVDLRDASGIAQVVIRDEAVAHGLRAEYVLQVTGEVGRRPAGNENPNLATGEVELVAAQVVVLNESEPLPFQVSSSLDETVGEEARLKYRYLDLRRPAPGPRDAPARQGEPGRAPRARRAGLRRGRDADPDALDARGRPRLPGARAPVARAPGTRSRSRRSCSSSCSWSAGSSGTTRSPAATATRTSAPTASRSSRSSTSR